MRPFFKNEEEKLKRAVLTHVDDLKTGGEETFLEVLKGIKGYLGVN